LVRGLALALVGAGCGSSTDPLPAGAVPMDAPAIFETWWHEVEQCSGKTGDYAAISWYYVPGAGTFAVGSDPEVVGLWQASNNSITVAQAVREYAPVVRHEELHAILQRADHPSEYFQDRCSSIIAH
jgi:hypothetical protein